MLLRNVVPVSFNYQDLITLFNNTFGDRFNTVLIAGEDEPVYLPADVQNRQHRIEFAHGFYASALHEIAHWLVAGEQRRLLVDYGYWYEPDGRDAKLQAEFEKVEITPQAIEWVLAASCGFKFDVSVDNLGGISIDRLSFKHKVHNRVMGYLKDGLSERAMLLINAFQDFYHTPVLSPELFNYQGLGTADANNIGTAHE
ncbi:elongation factor P hydroxylase [Psychromonas sp. MB-3u-54]|uniref:elongation factor P hydroxylase n=1 Tax=Psychromonas sp. MB-3u-54 TaxID=2058319 RepID=UPI000C32F374|nr:elongation factor P hydroxylase [Psychromonas sp. MB-3u-54]PKH02865.1 elongation factor P hydroxylase [Psychromonas sp. MB-3u-54]